MILAVFGVLLGGAGSGTLSGQSQVLVDEELAGAGVGSGAQSEADDDDYSLMLEEGDIACEGEPLGFGAG